MKNKNNDYFTNLKKEMERSFKNFYKGVNAISKKCSKQLQEIVEKMNEIKGDEKNDNK